MKNILFISPLPLYQNEAPSIHIIELSHALCQNGNKVTILAPNIVHLKQKYEFKVIYIPATKKFISFLYQPLLTFYCIYLAIVNRPDIVYYRISPLLIFPILISKLFRIKTIVEVNGVQDEEIQILGGKGLKLLGKLGLFKTIESINYKISDHIITVTEGIKNYVILKSKVDPQKITVINNGVNSDLFKPTKTKKTSIIQDYSLDNFYIGFVGGLVSWQGLDYVIKAIKRVADKHKNIRLIIAGDGNQKQHLNYLTNYIGLKKYVNFIGSIHHTEVPSLISLFDICISYPTSIRNGVTSPFKIYEYLSCEKPTIVSDIIGVKQEFKEVAVIAKAENDEDLSKKLILLIENDKLRKSLGKKARKYILASHTWKHVATLILKSIM